jgi:ubiquinol-cytochrome c reductase iron-sulfur subunit
MASLSRSFASAIVNRSYTNAPASSAALKRVFQLSSSSNDQHHEAHGSQPLFNAATKQRSNGGLINRSSVNGTINTFSPGIMD